MKNFSQSTDPTDRPAFLSFLSHSRQIPTIRRMNEEKPAQRAWSLNCDRSMSYNDSDFLCDVKYFSSGLGFEPRIKKCASAAWSFCSETGFTIEHKSLIFFLKRQNYINKKQRKVVNSTTKDFKTNTKQKEKENWATDIISTVLMPELRGPDAPDKH